METPQNPEGKIEKQRILEMLKANGFEHPETKELVVRWTVQ